MDQLAIVVVAVMLLAALAAIVSRLGTPRAGDQRYPYERIDHLFSPAERSFYGVLRQAAANRYLVFGKIRLADLVKTRPGLSPSERTTAHNKVSGKHVDFVLCEPTTLAIVGVIELDDKSHQAPARKQRDAFVDGVLNAAGVPVLHVPARKAYSTAEVAAQIQQMLA